jgi:tryptophanyl-tRNA synthetase
MTSSGSQPVEGAIRPVVLTCAQPSGQLTLGNLFGAIRNWLTFLDTHECFFGIVDQHAITVPYDPASLRQSSLDTLALYMACGLDPQRCHLFLQSHVVGHTELAWILGCLCPLGQLERMTQFKDKSQRQGEQVNSGLLFYPVLMAADILLYNADAVPVGEDQKQHGELCRDLAQKFNHRYSPTFKIPDLLIPKTGARLKSLQDPGRKMSKSDENENATLFLLDPPDRIRRKIASAVTDSGCEIRYDPESKPGISNLMEILSVCTGQIFAEIESLHRDQNYGAFKTTVAEALVSLLEPIQQRYRELRTDKEGLNTVLRNGAQAAQQRAYKTLAKVYRKAGFVERPR